MQVAAKPHRHRAAPSDPFNDPHTPSYSSYGVPTLTRNAPPQSASHRAPPPPPKGHAKSTSIRRAQPPVPMNMSRDNNVVEAVRDAVQVKSTDQSSRTRMARSNTEAPTYVVELLSENWTLIVAPPILSFVPRLLRQPDAAVDWHFSSFAFPGFRYTNCQSRRGQEQELS